jgi:hypothetical protein
MARTEGLYRREVECGEGNGDHDSGDSEAGYFHGNLLQLTILSSRSHGATPVVTRLM